MVYMHGGGFSSGSGHDLLSYDGESLARNHDVVVVTHNHRLNVYGYLNLKELGGEEYTSSANVGMLDIVAVLKWVCENITTFGGDPGCVTIFGQSGGGGKVLALMAMPATKGLFHRAIVQSGPFLKSLSPDYSRRLAELLLAELSLSRSQVQELQEISVDRLSSAAAEAMRKMHQPKSFLHPVFGEHDWGPTVDGHILPRHPFDPGAPEISADVPLLTGSNLHEFVNGLDRPEAQAMRVDELDHLVSQEFGDRSREIVDAYRCNYPEATPFDLYATIAAACVRRPAFEQASRKAALRAAPACSYIYAWRTPVLNGRPAHSMLLKLPSLLITLKSVITTPVAFQRHSSCRNRLVMRGRILLEPEILVTVACRAGPRTDRSAVQRCTSTRHVMFATMQNKRH